MTDSVSPAGPPTPSVLAPMPWSDALAFGIGVLGLAPKDFWSMTPRELSAALTTLTPQSDHQPTQSDLTALMARYPDRSANE